MGPADQAEEDRSRWASRGARHLAVGVGWLVLAAVMLAAALLHRSALRYGLFGAWATVGLGFLVDAARHRDGHAHHDA